jgi:hypothetical protein
MYTQFRCGNLKGGQLTREDNTKTDVEERVCEHGVGPSKFHERRKGEFCGLALQLDASQGLCFMQVTWSREYKNS